MNRLLNHTDEQDEPSKTAMGSVHSSNSVYWFLYSLEHLLRIGFWDEEFLTIWKM